MRSTCRQVAVNRFKTIDGRIEETPPLDECERRAKERGFDPRVFLAMILECRRLLTFRKGKYRSTRNLTVRWRDIEAHERYRFIRINRKHRVELCKQHQILCFFVQVQ